LAKTPTAGGSKAKGGSAGSADAKKGVAPKSLKAPIKKTAKAPEPAKKAATVKEAKPAPKAPAAKSPAPKKPETKVVAKAPEPGKPVKKTPPPLVIKDRATLAKAAAKEREREQKAAKTAELMKKTERPGLTPSAKTAAGGKGKKEAAAAGPRFQSAFADSMADGKAAAAKLSAAAGLANLKKTKSEWLVRDENAVKLKKSPLSKKQLQEFRDLLVIKRAQLIGNVNAMESEALTGGGSGSLSHLPQHMADAGTDTFDQSLALDLAAQQRGVLKEIDAAIKRIDDNTFGICELIGTPIDIERLNAEPWTRYSIEAKREIERTGLPRA
jgi:RNA polymerase-binding transcription factor DksA